MNLMANLLMLMAAVIWGYAAFRDAESSEKLEWALSGLMANAAAMVLWNLERGTAAMLVQWLPCALAAATSTLLLHLLSVARQHGALGLRRFFPPVAYVAMTLCLGLGSPELKAATATPAPEPAELHGEACAPPH